jgi:SAM-dependent methyltransferase
LRYLAKVRRDLVPPFETLIRQPHRPLIRDHVLSFGAVSTVLEVGCGRGANLYGLARSGASPALLGVDLSALAVSQAREELALRGVVPLRLEVATATDLSAFPDRSADVVFSDAVLMYVPPRELALALGEMLRVARLGIVVSGWHAERPEGEEPSLYDEGTWIHDLSASLRRLACGNVRVIRYPDGVWSDRRWQDYGVIITAKICGPGTEVPGPVRGR